MRLLLFCLLLLVASAGIAAAQPLPPIDNLAAQSANFRRQMDPTRCPGAGDVSGPPAWDRKNLRFVCAATPTPAVPTPTSTPTNTPAATATPTNLGQSFIAVNNESSLTAERRGVCTTPLVCTDSGANSDFTWSIPAATDSADGHLTAADHKQMNFAAAVIIKQLGGI
jgi:hypothetical protein